jgi:uncharacterized membrane protein
MYVQQQREGILPHIQNVKICNENTNLIIYEVLAIHNLDAEKALLNNLQKKQKKLPCYFSVTILKFIMTVYKYPIGFICLKIEIVVHAF